MKSKKVCRITLVLIYAGGEKRIENFGGETRRKESQTTSISKDL
jgi:hypothetical protein